MIWFSDLTLLSCDLDFGNIVWFYLSAFWNLPHKVVQHKMLAFDLDDMTLTLKSVYINYQLVWPCGILKFQNLGKLQFRIYIFQGQTWLKPWYKKKTKLVWHMGSYCIHWKPSLPHSSSICVALLGIQLLEYGLTHHNHLVFS